MVTATLTMIARDFQLFINAIMRLLFFITPILWTIENLSPTLRMIMQLNPFLYVVDGFRDSILYNIPFYAHIVRMPVFLTVAILLWVWGCNMLMRFKDDFLDLL